MVTIDLTQDSMPERQAHVRRKGSSQDLPLRSHIQSHSLKRKSEPDSESSVEAPHKRFSNGTQPKEAMSPGLRLPRTPSPVKVVIPTPTGDQKREIERLNREYNEPIGVSQLHFPIDAHKKSVAKGAYPALRTVDRSTAVLEIATLSPARPNSISAVKTQLAERLRSKLASIKGPGVTVAPRDELALARTTQNFQFVNSYQLRAGVKPIDEVFNSGCSCGDACSPENCNCVDNDPLSNAKIVPYERAADGSRLFVLTPQLLGKSSMIYECNRRCDCAGHCWNAVVQKSRTVRLEIFRTQNRGFGLRSPDYIQAGQFIDRYLGELITQKSADKREELEQGHSYLFTLDWHEDDDPDYSPLDEDDEDETDNAGPYVIDGQKYGSPTRFMNHSCSPNCKIVPSTPDHGSSKIYDLAFFAVKDIPAMTELTFDYNPDWRGSSTKKADPNAVQCLCGEPNCRKQLWPNTRKAMK